MVNCLGDISKYKESNLFWKITVFSFLKFVIQINLFIIYNLPSLWLFSVEQVLIIATPLYAQLVLVYHTSVLVSPVKDQGWPERALGWHGKAPGHCVKVW